MRFCSTLLVLSLCMGGCSQPSQQEPKASPPEKPVSEEGSQPSPGLEISQPFTHDNLTVFVVSRGSDANHRQVMTLEKALEDGTARVVETGTVNELMVENLSADTELFIQAGEIVKGGRQDRVMGTDILVKPKSGQVPIGTFCVEQGRWSGRGDESVQTFHKSDNMVSSNSMKASIQNSKSQRQVWNDVHMAQGALNENVGEDVTRNASASSLQLSLESDALIKKKEPYIAALSVKIEEQKNAVGLVIAINGKLHNADLYQSPSLFSALCSKLLDAGVTEAISQADKPKAGSIPTIQDVHVFLNAAEDTPVTNRQESGSLNTIVRENDEYCLWESLKDGDWVHRSYIVKP